MTQLADLPLGREARVVRILGNDEIALRLLEMGLTPGIEVRLIGRAPLGDPLEFEVRGYRLSIRKSEAARVEIESE
ncbi:MAG TPA: ferrous iron transport protein A [Pirellulales bacterium]